MNSVRSVIRDRQIQKQQKEGDHKDGEGGGNSNNNAPPLPLASSSSSSSYSLIGPVLDSEFAIGVVRTAFHCYKRYRENIKKSSRIQLLK
jgi:hypothetical protein